MCGITGIYHFDSNRPVSYKQLKKMTDIIRYRGPDDEGHYVEGSIGLGHRRLAIIDLNTGDQPMFNEDKSIALVYNGEIYNYVELREELISLGFSFSTNSDTEVIIKAYEAWGTDCQSKFNGMWAFALWDKRSNQLLLSRDRIGEKPLHYTMVDNSIIFGSEIKSLFEYGMPKIFRPELIEIYLVLNNIPAPHTFFKDIYKLMPGHFIVVKDGKMTDNTYWDLPEIDESNMNTNKDDVYEQFEYLFRDSVRIRMRSDVPFGAFLSGGLDSSSIVATMSDISKFPVHTFTIGFNDIDFDESNLAAMVASRYKTNHIEGEAISDEFNEVLNSLSFHYDEPFGDSSAIPTGVVSKLAANKVKMVLTGDGGDEVLSGYTSYQGVKFANKYQKFPMFVRNSIYSLINLIIPLIKGRYRYKLNRIKNVLYTSNLDFNERIVNKRATTDFKTIKKLTSQIKGIIPVEDFMSDFMAKCPYKDEFYKLMWFNFKFDLPNDFLVKVDRMSMAYSLETRLPFLDHRLIEYMVHVHKDVKMQGWERKSVLRNTGFCKGLPNDILHAPKKGFSIPLRNWFKDDSFRNTIGKARNLSSLLDEKMIDKILKENTEEIYDNGSFIWHLLILEKVLSK